MMIHWHEGLHLLPQHLQALQKLVLDSTAQTRPFLHRFGSGIIDLELEFENQKVRVKRLKAIMPSGVLLDYPKNVEVREVDVGPELSRRRDGFRLSLGLPVWSAHQRNAFEMGVPPGPARLRYRLDETQLCDENVGGEGRPTYVRKFNARLLLESDDESDLEVIPVARVEASAGSGLPRVDERYCPPLLRLKGWQPVYDLVRKGINDIEYSKANLLGRLGEGGFNIQSLHGDQLSLLLKLQAANRHLSFLRPLLEADQAAPFEVFCELQSLLGELAALDPLNIPFEAAPFAHASPGEQFREVLQKILKHLEPTATTLFRRYEFTSQEDNRYFLAKFEPNSVTLTSEPFLLIESADLRGVVDELVLGDSFLITDSDAVVKAFSGLKVTRREAPRGLSANPKFHYFHVDPASDPSIWNTITETGKIALSFSKKVPKTLTTFALYLS